MPAIPTRLRLAVDALAHKPASRVLEIGCGTGLAAALVVKKLRTGRLVALDRSATAIAAARKRNPVAQAAGKIAFVTGELATAKLPTRRFDVIFAVHVNCFWTRDAARELTVVREALAPRGTLHLFYEAMTADPARILACGETIAAALGRHGFADIESALIATEPRPLLRIRARRGPNF